MKRAERRVFLILAAALAIWLLWKVAPQGTDGSNISFQTGNKVPPQVGRTENPQASVEAEFNPEKTFSTIMESSPVVIFSKSYCPFSKKGKLILQELYSLDPPPTVIELDLLPHGAELQEYVGKRSGRRTVPNVFVVGETRGGGDDMEALYESKTLASSFEKWSNSLVKVTPNDSAMKDYEAHKSAARENKGPH